MKTRTSHRWKANRPGGWDVLNTRYIFPASNPWGIPDMKADCIDIQGKVLFPFNLKRYGENHICHFFLDDYQFERVWRRPTVYPPQLKKYYAVCTPDFSLYTDWPLAMNLWNVYRNRWLGCYWQRLGIKVIPTVGWAGKDSYEYTFEGIPRGSVVAISPPDLRDPAVARLFYQGLHALIEKVDPSIILSYGDPKLTTDFPSYSRIVVFEKVVLWGQKPIPRYSSTKKVPYMRRI